MDLNKINSKLTEIQIRAGRIKFNKNFFALNTGFGALCGTTNAIMLINHSHILLKTSISVITIYVGLSGLQWYLEAQKLNKLKVLEKQFKEKIKTKNF